MRCRVFQKYSAHRLVTTLSTHRHAAFWNTRHAVVFPMFQKWPFGASSRDSGRYVDADLIQTAIPQINQMAISFKTFTMPSLREIWVTLSTTRRELRHEDFWTHGTQRHAVCFKMCMLSAASPVYIHTTHFSTKRRELRHKDFWNRRHAVRRRLSQNVNLERCVANIYPYNPFSHEATGASSWRLLKQTAHSATPTVSTHIPTKRRELRHEDFWNTWHIAPRRLFQNVHVGCCVTSIHPYNPFLDEAPRASPQRLLKQTARCAAPSVSKCESWVLRRQYISIQPISPWSDGSFVTKTFETHGTQRHAVCFKMCMLGAASPVYIHTTHFSTKRRELRHKDFWNRRHAVPRRLFQNVNLERCVANINQNNPFPHEATGAWSRRLLKQTAHSAAPSVSKCVSGALRRQYTSL